MRINLSGIYKLEPLLVYVFLKFPLKRRAQDFGSYHTRMQVHVEMTRIVTQPSTVDYSNRGKGGRTARARQ